MRTRLSQRLHVCTVFVGLWNLSRVAILWIYCCLSQEPVIQHVVGSKDVDYYKTSGTLRLKIYQILASCRAIEDLAVRYDRNVVTVTLWRKCTAIEKLSSLGRPYYKCTEVYPWDTNSINWVDILLSRYDERVRDLLDFSIYLDISDDVKFAWKIQVWLSPSCVPYNNQKTLLSKTWIKEEEIPHVACLFPLTCHT